MLTIRNLPADIHTALRIRAARRGRSLNAEAVAVLTASVTRQDLRLAQQILPVAPIPPKA